MLSRVLPITFVGSVLCLGIFQSVAAVSEVRAGNEALTKTNVIRLADVQDNAQIGALVQNSDDFKKEEDLLTAQWDKAQNCRTPEATKRFVDVVAKLASLKQQEGAFEQAVYCYGVLLTQDLKDDTAGKDLRIARDYLNTGLSYALWQTTTTDGATREKLTRQAMENLDKAEALYLKSGNREALYSVYVNRYELLKDVGDAPGASKMFEKFSAMDAKKGEKTLFIKQG